MFKLISYFDRFESPYHQSVFPDLQDSKVYARCHWTDGEIYEGELCIETHDGYILKYDIDVLVAYINARVTTAGERDC